jgi:protein tyrosine phosphatase
MTFSEKMDLISGNIDVFGKTINFTRQESAVIMMLKDSPRTSRDMCDILFSEFNSKLMGVHLFNIRQKLSKVATIKYDPKSELYALSRVKGE